jgi:hypothetical protein
VRIAKFENVETHDELEPVDDGFCWEAFGEFVGPEECSDFFKGVIPNEKTE